MLGQTGNRLTFIPLNENGSYKVISLKILSIIIADLLKITSIKFSILYHKYQTRFFLSWKAKILLYKKNLKNYQVEVIKTNLDFWKFEWPSWPNLKSTLFFKQDLSLLLRMDKQDGHARTSGGKESLFKY